MAIKAIDFYNELSKIGVEFFTGVPDSLLKEFCLCIDDQVPEKRHIIAANEGNAIALASGYYMASKSIPLVYMQNSGLGNAINPLLSLCDPDVYSLPILLMIGWRGEPGSKDEPQHIKQGKIQLDLLKTMDIHYEIISASETELNLKIRRAFKIANDQKTPVVLLIRKGTFDKYNNLLSNHDNKSMSREKALEIIIEKIDEKTIVVSTTGKTSREIFEIRNKRSQSHKQDFLSVGSMGHCSSIALGIALSKPNSKVVCIDGDGSMLMHLGSLAIISNLKPKNFRYILLNNEVHDSVGGQSTAAKQMNLLKLVKSFESFNTYYSKTENNLRNTIEDFILNDGPSFIEVKISPGSRDNLGRPTIKPINNKNNFMKFLEK